MLAASLRQFSCFLRNPRTGWIGIDISQSGAHLAQVERSGSGYELRTAWTAFQTVTDSSTEESFDLLIEQTRRVRPLFLSAPAALTIGDGSIDYRELDLAINESSEIDPAVRSLLEREPDFDFGFSLIKAWELPANRRSQVPHKNAAVVSIPHPFSMWLGDRITRVGYSPEVLDAIPCALARSAEIFLEGSDRSCLVAHLGDACTTLSLVRRGTPILTRVLHSLGFEQVLKPLRTELSIGSGEVNSLILKTAQARTKGADHASDLQDIVSEYQLRFVQALACEIYSTLEYIRSELIESEPAGLLLCGNGSIMPDMSTQFQQLLEIPTDTWSIPLQAGTCQGLPTSLYAVAAGLSAIAWENS